MVKSAQNKPFASRAQAETKMYQDIYDAVMEHRLPPQTKLTEQTLCDIYDLARHDVRKVLTQLAADGLVDFEPNRGAFIASPSTLEAQELFELRESLEALVIDKVAQSASEEDLAELQSMVEQERLAWQQGDRPTWIRLSADFHVALSRLAGNGSLTHLLRRLVSRSTLLISGKETSGDAVCSFDEHAHILSRLQAGDKTGAQKSMARHLQGCARRLTINEGKSFDLRSALIRN